MGFFDIFKKKKKMSDGLEKTRTDFFQNIVNTLTSSVIDDDLYNDLEEQLILADVGPSCAVRLVDELRDEVEINGLHTGQEALDALRDIIRREVSPKTDLDLSGKPAVILVVGVNGVGKTTTIAKLAYLYKDLGKRVMLAAGDTFRAAASEQLETWADRAGVPLVKAGEGADPAAVIFDAVKSATARGYDMVIADTAGRLHNKKSLMDEPVRVTAKTRYHAKEAAKTAHIMLHAKNCPAGKMPVAIDNGFGGVIFHEACGHSLEATAVAKGNSVFCDKLGQQIASSKITAIDDGTMKNHWGSSNIDDEGTPTRRNVLIENGILKSYMVDKLNARRMNTEVTGSSRRQSYKYEPTSRMTNTYIAPGEDKVEDIIKSIDDGLYAKKMGGGSVNPVTGEFNFAVSEGYLVKNGEITEPVRGASLIGKGSEILMDIDMVSDNVAQAEGMCGSKSGSIPVNVGQPMIRVKSITVGGRE